MVGIDYPVKLDQTQVLIKMIDGRHIYVTIKESGALTVSSAANGDEAPSRHVYGTLHKPCV